METKMWFLMLLLIPAGSFMWSKPQECVCSHPHWIHEGFPLHVLGILTWGGPRFRNYFYTVTGDLWGIITTGPAKRQAISVEYKKIILVQLLNVCVIKSYALQTHKTRASFQFPQTMQINTVNLAFWGTMNTQQSNSSAVMLLAETGQKFKNYCLT